METVVLFQVSQERGFTNVPKPYYVVVDVSRLRFFLSLWVLRGLPLRSQKVLIVYPTIYNNLDQ